MKKFTKRVALRACADLWSWLSLNTKNQKRDWPGWSPLKAQYNLSDDLIGTGCPCCIYARIKSGIGVEGSNGDHCKYCPLAGISWRDDYFGCLTDSAGSYRVWRDARDLGNTLAIHKAALQLSSESTIALNRELRK